jgi:hypothetical protein
MTTFYCLRFETPPTWRARSAYLYPPGRGSPIYTPSHWVPFSSPPTTRRTTVEVFDPASTRDALHSKENTSVAQQWIYSNPTENTCDIGSIVTCVYRGRYLEMGLYITILFSLHLAGCLFLLIFYPDDEGSFFLRNVGELRAEYMALHLSSLGMGSTYHIS